jgi:hypothetical protein
MADPIAAINRILKAVDLDSDTVWLNSLRANLKAQPQKKQVSHQYASSQFGLDSAKMRERFTAYMADYELASTGLGE